MSIVVREILLEHIEQLERPINPEERSSLLSVLRNIPTDIDDKRGVEWKRGSIYFHALGDTFFAARMADNPRSIRGSQVCFVKDLDEYLAGFPQEESEMFSLFQKIFDIGTSAYWDQDIELVKDLYRIFDELDKKLIRPWVQAGVK